MIQQSLTIVSVYSINLSSDTSLIFLASLRRSRKKFYEQKNSVICTLRKTLLSRTKAINSDLNDCEPIRAHINRTNISLNFFFHKY